MLTTAVTRFRRELERKLGDEMEAAFKAFQNASESSANELTKEGQRLASAFHAADWSARTTGFRDAQEASFDVRMDSELR